jgi:hypothetical protein
MAEYSHINLETIAESQSGKEITANSAIEALAKGVGVISVSVAAGNVQLTEAQSLAGIILLTGAPGAARVVTVDSDISRWILFRNDTTGGQVVEVEQAGGTNFPVPAGGCVLLLSTTQAITFHSDTAPLALTKTATAGTSGQLARVDHRHPRDWVELLFNDAHQGDAFPAGETALFGQPGRRARYDLTQFSEARLISYVVTAGPAGCQIRGKYSTDGTTFAYLDGSSGPAITIDSTGEKDSGWVTLTAGAKAEVRLLPFSILGDGATTPILARIALLFR